MLARIIIAATATCTLQVAAHRCLAQPRNCPEALDQLVIVEPGVPTAFRLHVVNVVERNRDGFAPWDDRSGFDAEVDGAEPRSSSAQISVFQYPLGGVLQQTGPTPLDFVFVANADFNGTTEFTYRINPPAGCPGGFVLGSVTLAGGASDGTAAGVVPTVPTRLCGVSLPHALSTAALSIAFVGSRVRKRRIP